MHEIARERTRDARVVDVDNDPMAFLHAEALTATDPLSGVVHGSPPFTHRFRF